MFNILTVKKKKQKVSKFCICHEFASERMQQEAPFIDVKKQPIEQMGKTIPTITM